VFDAPVSDVKKKARRGAAPAEEGAETPKRRGGGRKKKSEEEKVQEAQELATEKLQEAEGLVHVLEQVHVTLTRKRFAGRVDDAQLDAILAAQKFNAEERNGIARPLAEILAREGVELPPEARLALAGLAAMIPRMMVLQSWDAQLSPKGET